mmetsp:Transcript_14682/g.20962  ORF Transcript_14682/g.20962 Transcript_14682/m.20962 type:complete len:157 (+) Transcript_14682:104-574(+)|eukprot:CAMPEP_0184859258 /NCGR_PEP_ID=MMETSP0580-20130426/4256_1 /TAXON_ID=1118495 /ORGANISM="Dactyliosolen fragilissimus" /LENGTH=156 /DNA_ID=CAMNT_0027355777 /DNA_START=60 /DNA_END=530 /DNA_ORIENTATION=-
MMKAVLLLISLLFATSNAFTTSQGAPTFIRSQLKTQRHNIIDVVSSMVNNFGKKATCSHILIGPRQWESEEQAREKLIEIKAEIGDDPAKFAEFAAEYSGCPSRSKGGNLGEFGPGQMVRNFDKVAFNEEVGIVHGPISTQYGEHLILVTERTGED